MPIIIVNAEIKRIIIKYVCMYLFIIIITQTKDKVHETSLTYKDSTSNKTECKTRREFHSLHQKGFHHIKHRH